MGAIMSRCAYTDVIMLHHHLVPSLCFAMLLIENPSSDDMSGDENQTGYNGTGISKEEVALCRTTGHIRTTKA